MTIEEYLESGALLYVGKPGKNYHATLFKNDELIESSDGLTIMDSVSFLKVKLQISDQDDGETQ